MRTKLSLCLIVAMGAGLFLILSCTDPFYPDAICVGVTGESISITDQNNNPVTGAEFSVVNTRTGKELCADENGNLDEKCAANLGETDHMEEDRYWLVTSLNANPDEPTADIRHLDIIEATAELNSHSVSAKYIVDLGNTSCRIAGVEGPDPLVLSISEN